MKRIIPTAKAVGLWTAWWTLLIFGTASATLVVCYCIAELREGEVPFKTPMRDIGKAVTAALTEKKGPRVWELQTLSQDVNGPPRAGQYPAYASRLDLAVAPRQDIFPAVKGDPESDPQIDRIGVSGGASELAELRNPFQPGTRPADSTEESDNTHEWRP